MVEKITLLEAILRAEIDALTLGRVQNEICELMGNESGAGESFRLGTENFLAQLRLPGIIG
jgi:hypothetical protein